MNDCSCFDDNGAYCANCLANKYAQEMIENLRANVAEDKKRREEQLKNLAGLKDVDIDLSDIPALTDEQLETAIRGKMQRAYNATPEQLGKAAVEGARREQKPLKIPWRAPVAALLISVTVFGMFFYKWAFFIWWLIGLFALTLAQDSVGEVKN